jgi:hypothetical protein
MGGYRLTRNLAVAVTDTGKVRFQDIGIGRPPKAATPLAAKDYVPRVLKSAGKYLDVIGFCQLGRIHSFAPTLV